MGAEDAPREALVYAARAIAALNGVHTSQWRATVVSSTEVEDAPINPQP